jgi:hypothetical protein
MMRNTSQELSAAECVTFFRLNQFVLFLAQADDDGKRDAGSHEWGDMKQFGVKRQRIPLNPTKNSTVPTFRWH